VQSLCNEGEHIVTGIVIHDQERPRNEAKWKSGQTKESANVCFHA
jgi:hypothetical protein